MIFSKNDQPHTRYAISRRELLGLGITAAAASLIPSEIYAAVKEQPPERTVRLYNVYTHETLETVYWKNGEYLPEVMSEINHIFRDIRTGKVRDINRNLIDLLYSLRKKTGADTPFHIISGYRTPRSNALLRRTKKGVAKNSLHIYGKAVDIRLPYYSLRTLRRKAMELRGGGVGYYPHSKFLHVDVGAVRYWRG